MYPQNAENTGFLLQRNERGVRNERQTGVVRTVRLCDKINFPAYDGLASNIAVPCPLTDAKTAKAIGASNTDAYPDPRSIE